MITYIIAILLVVICAIYLHGIKNFKYWKVRGVKHDKPEFLFGNLKNVYLLKQSMTQWITEVYWRYPNEKIVGFFRSRRPGLIIRDPEIIKQVLVTDFLYFHPRGFIKEYTEVEPLLRNLFFAHGDLWKLLRQRMTPAFTSGKLKAMFPLIVERAERLQMLTLAAATEGRPLDARDIMARYTTDFIGACGFGLDADSLNNEDSDFRKLGMQIFQVGYIDAIKAALKEFYPEIFKNFKFLTGIENDLFALVNAIMTQRNFTPTNRHDFIDLLLECKQQGTIVGESLEKLADGTPKKATLELDNVLLAAQVYIFFAAGFETSSSATSYTLHELAFNQDVQRKVQKEIDRVLAKHDNKLSYDAISEMTYLDWTLKEGFRSFPSLGYISRECDQKYTFADLNVSIDKGVTMVIPIQALHNDPQYFESPEEFRPKRFDSELFDTKSKNVFLPFGMGPRACIGARLGTMQSLAGLAAILSQFTVTPAPETLRKPIVDPKGDVVQSIKGGLPLLFNKRKTVSEEK